MHYVIVGNGVAGITAAFALRKRDARAKITVISGESEYFFSRTALMYAFLDRMNLRDLEPFERKVYQKQRIDLLHGWVEDLNADRRELRLKDGAEIQYDRLLLATGSAPNRPDWPGLGEVKEGVVHFVSLQHLAECERLTPSTRRAVVVGGGLIGVELVECLVHHGVEVDFLVREDWYWPMALAPEEGKLIAQHLRHHGVRLHLQDEVTGVESGTGSRVSAVQTGQGKKLPCEMLGICIGVRPAVDWLRGVATPPALGRGIQVDRGFRTSLRDVWAAGDCAEFQRPDGTPFVEQIWYSAKRQGELAARAMLGDSIRYEPPLFFNSAKFFEIEYTTVGATTRLPDTARSFFHRWADREATIRIVEENGAVTGFSMLGSRWDHTVLERWVGERRSLDDVVARLHEAQFDVEFGRVPLAGLRAAFGAREVRA
ncbi:MAG: NAD(P)/FAD-dependent oxidoreductase [Bryobacteraceae bacterium]|nr:NAD(P)/FAD-dependent oxidoreductase [Bryobacteraceae bacterium]